MYLDVKHPAHIILHRRQLSRLGIFKKTIRKQTYIVLLDIAKNRVVRRNNSVTMQDTRYI